MLRAWRAIFTTVDSETAPQESDSAAARADVSTPLAAAGLSARAVSALATAQVATVGELLALDSTPLNRLVAREAKDTQKEIRTRYREWTKRLGKQRTVSDQLMGLDDAVGLLLTAVSAPRAATTRRRAAELILGVTPGLDAFASSAELAEKLGKTTPRGIQVLKELQDDWAKNADARELLDAITEIAKQVVTDFGGVAAVSTLTAEIRARLPQSGVTIADWSAHDRAAGGLLRVALDRLSEHETASGTKEFVRRRHGRRLALLADDEMLLAAAEAAGERADKLVSADVAAVVPASTAARELRAAFCDGYRAVSDAATQIPVPADARLVRLAAAISRHAAVSGRGELHNRNMPPAAAVRVALTGLAQSESLSPSQVRSRVTARFPELDRIPLRPHLDTLIAQTGLDLKWDGEAYRFRVPEPPSATTMHTHTPTAVPGAGDLAAAALQQADHDAALQRCVDERGFLAIGVPIPPDRPGEHQRVARVLARAYGGEVLDITTRLITVMRELAERQGVSWDLIRSADAAAPGSRDARGLRAVIDRVMPQLAGELRASVFDGPGRVEPLILTEVSPLARYGHLDILAELSDLSAPRRRPVWVLLPQLRGQTGALVDRKPMQLGSPGQFVVWREAADAVPA